MAKNPLYFNKNFNAIPIILIFHVNYFCIQKKKKIHQDVPSVTGTVTVAFYGNRRPPSTAIFWPNLHATPAIASQPSTVIRTPLHLMASLVFLSTTSFKSNMFNSENNRNPNPEMNRNPKIKITSLEEEFRWFSGQSQRWRGEGGGKGQKVNPSWSNGGV